MKIALSAPADLRALSLYFDQDPTVIPRGLGSTAVTPLVAAFLERGHDVTLFTISRDVERETVITGTHLTAFVGPCRTSRRARNFWKNEIDYLAGAIRREQPAFVHAHWTYEFAMGALKSGVPTITTIHDLPWNVLRHFLDPYRAARVLLAYQVARRCRYFTAVSADAAIHFRRYLRPGVPISIVPNFLPDSVFAIGLAARASRPIAFYTVLQGWTTRKNAKAALRAFALTRKLLPWSRLLMIGTDYQPGGPAYAWAKDHGLMDRVDFLGPLPYKDMLATVLTEADILVHPSLDESFSMAALEGMALRKPVIAGRCTPGVREVLEFGRCGLLVDVRNPSEIAAAMERLGTNAQLRHSITSTAFASAYHRFRAQPVLLAYEALYEGLLTESSRGAYGDAISVQEGSLTTNRSPEQGS